MNTSIFPGRFRSAVRVIRQQSGRPSRRASPPARHLEATLAWLRRAQDVTGTGGIAAYYGLWGAWGQAYPETTGYTIPTFLRCARAFGEDFEARALRMAAWLLDTQLPSGAFPGGLWTPGVQRPPSVFNTGQILLGIAEAFRHTGEEKFRQSAARAAAWLCEVQDADGKWSKFAYKNQVHSYNSRVAWSLLEAGDICAREEFHAAAARHLEWTLACQQENGWFRYAPFWGDRAFTHTICYVLEGLLEASRFREAGRYRAAVRRTLEQLLPRVAEDGFLSGSFDSAWRDRRYCCLTGNAQLAGVCYLWAALEPAFFDMRKPRALLEFVARTQDLDTPDANLRGAVAGSFPIWGRYLMFRYPNWAAKFFADALLWEQSREGRPEAATTPRSSTLASPSS